MSTIIDFVDRPLFILKNYQWQIGDTFPWTGYNKPKIHNHPKISTFYPIWEGKDRGRGRRSEGGGNEGRTEGGRNKRTDSYGVVTLVNGSIYQMLLW